MKEKIKYLVEKQIMLRQEFEAFLLMWEKETEEIDDNTVRRIIVYNDEEEKKYYLLEVGEREVFSIRHGSWEEKFFESKREAELNIKLIRKITETLEKNLQEWMEQVDRCSEAYQNCIAILKKIMVK